MYVVSLLKLRILLHVLVEANVVFHEEFGRGMGVVDLGRRIDDSNKVKLGRFAAIVATRVATLATRILLLLLLRNRAGASERVVDMR